MKAQPVVERHGVRLRPATVGDAAFIVELRRSGHAAGFINETSPDVAAQEEWLRLQAGRIDDHYFVVETMLSGRQVGTVGIYNLRADSAEFGRWIILPGVPAAPASAWLAFYTAFDVLNLSEVNAHTLESNHNVISFNRQVGFACVGFAPQVKIIDGARVRQYRFHATRSDWPAIGAALERFATRAARYL